MCVSEGHDFLLFGAILQHLHEAPGGVGQAAKLGLLRHAQMQAGHLQTSFAIPALITCLRVRPLIRDSVR